MDKQSKMQIESTCLNKKRNRSKDKNNIKKVKDERYVILNTIIKKLYDYFNAYCIEFKQVYYPLENKQTESEPHKEDILYPLNSEIETVNDNKSTSKQLLKDAQQYYNEHIKIPNEIDFKQKYEEPITEDSFYNMSFHYINVNYLSGEIVNKIVQIKDEPDSMKHYEIQLNLLESIKTFFSYLKLVKFNLFEKQTILYQSVYRDIILSCFIDFSVL